MTLLTRANRAYLKKVAPNVGDTFTVTATYHIKPVARSRRGGAETYYDDRYRFEGDRAAEHHLDVLTHSGHLRLMQDTKTRTFVEKPLKSGGPDVYFEAKAVQVREYRRRK
ncbi:hypothetical protein PAPPERLAPAPP_03850 [Brevundimonas phage vB_BpoS-Papperlapapp]|nr:hypothetical protein PAPPERLAPAPP_03850 [Brevundimonas phage vB_BpoS-Papperlapapp]